MVASVITIITIKSVKKDVSAQCRAQASAHKRMTRHSSKAVITAAPRIYSDQTHTHDIFSSKNQSSPVVKYRSFLFPFPSRRCGRILQLLLRPPPACLYSKPTASITTTDVCYSRELPLRFGLESYTNSAVYMLGSSVSLGSISEGLLRAFPRIKYHEDKVDLETDVVLTNVTFLLYTPTNPFRPGLCICPRDVVVEGKPPLYPKCVILACSGKWGTQGQRVVLLNWTQWPTPYTVETHNCYWTTVTVWQFSTVLSKQGTIRCYTLEMFRKDFMACVFIYQYLQSRGQKPQLGFTDSYFEWNLWKNCFCESLWLRCTRAERRLTAIMNSTRLSLLHVLVLLISRV